MLRVEPRAAEPLGRRRDVRQPDRDRRASRDPDDWNRTWGADARLGVGEHFTLAGFARAHRDARAAPAATTPTTSTRNTTTAGTASDFEYGRDRRGLQSRGRLPRERGRLPPLSTSASTRRCGRRRFAAGDFASGCRTSNYTRYDYLDGGLNNAELHVDNHWDWENGNSHRHRAQRHVGRAPRAVRDLSRRHRAGRASTAACGSRCARTPIAGSGSSARMQWDVGRFLTGDQNSPTLQVTHPATADGFTVDTTWTYRCDRRCRRARSTPTSGNMRVTYNFTPSVFVQSLMQYNDRTERWSTNLRFHWLETAGTGLFVVYNDTESLERPRPGQPRVHRQVRAAVRSSSLTISRSLFDRGADGVSVDLGIHVGHAQRGRTEQSHMRGGLNGNRHDDALDASVGPHNLNVLDPEGRIPGEPTLQTHEAAVAWLQKHRARHECAFPPLRRQKNIGEAFIVYAIGLEGVVRRIEC